MYSLGNPNFCMNIFSVSVSLEMKRFEGEKKMEFRKVAFHKIMKFANFKLWRNRDSEGHLACYEKICLNLFHCSQSTKGWC